MNSIDTLKLYNKFTLEGMWVGAPCAFWVSRIELLSSPACRKRRQMEASRRLPGAIPPVVKV